MPTGLGVTIRSHIDVVNCSSPPNPDEMMLSTI